MLISKHVHKSHEKSTKKSNWNSDTEFVARLWSFHMRKDENEFSAITLYLHIDCGEKSIQITNKIYDFVVNAYKYYIRIRVYLKNFEKEEKL